MKHNLLLAGAISVALLGCQNNTGSDSNTVDLQILAINDFHGHIATTSDKFGGTGRADFLAANIKAAQENTENSILVSAGDLIGGSPLISSFFHDEPTIEAMNLIGLELNSVGNHEFDEGPVELLRMQNGGSHPVDGDLDGDSFSGAEFDFLAANVVVDATEETLFPAYSIKNYDGIDVAFIGMTLEGTPSVVSPSGIIGLSFKDEIETVNNLVPTLQDQGIESFVVLLHEGGLSGGGQTDCETELKGPIVDIAEGLDDAVDVVIAGHTNEEFICEIDGKMVTMADTKGRLFTEINVTLDKTTQDMTIVSAVNIANLQKNVTPDATLTTLIDKYREISNQFSQKIVGTITEDITSTNNKAGESALGDVITDAQLLATSTAGAQIAFTANGGIRANLIFDSQGDEKDGEVTFEEAFSVQPFSNILITMTLTGQQIHDILERQFTDTEILQISKGFSYEWSKASPDGDKVNPATIMLNGTAISLTKGYRVTVNKFLSDGGDDYTTFTKGTDRERSSALDSEALVDYLKSSSPVSGPQDRIVMIP